MTAESGALIGGRYRLVELRGRGGMGRVWRGLDERLDREVAVKEIVFPDGVDEERREALLHRFVREARAAARLNDPGIITVHDVVEHEGAPVIVMEYVTGPSLAAQVARGGGMPVRRVAELGVLMVKALRRAHAAGIVHRDLKPDNVLLMDDRVIITDFGIAHVADATMTLTRTGTLLGTPAYMAPEQLEGGPPTPATDLWSLGATLYCALEGRPPFVAETFSALCVAIVMQDPPVPGRAGPLAPVLAALLTKDPAGRATAEQALAALEAVAGGAAQREPQPQPQPPPQPQPEQRRRQRLPGSSLRGAGCFALVWLGTLLPWNHIREWHGFQRELLVGATAAVVALANAGLRPRGPAGPGWARFAGLNLALFLVAALIWPVWGLPAVIANGLLVGTVSWSLWWSLSRAGVPAGVRPDGVSERGTR
ncbi:serine/threonine-protein kinase [Streptomyces goshikiensis]|uniref:serine/threonine-protein kinase n=1 Tax=Streptomyces goshikiensis TaxID=1942 RepID=UPI002AE0A212|nr:serine/threonine-protein kinase [Streptomyces goshikiensis]